MADRAASGAADPRASAVVSGNARWYAPGMSTDTSHAPEPTIRDVLAELRALRRVVDEHGKQLTEHGQKLDTLTSDITEHGKSLRSLTCEVETLGRETRELHAELLTELPAAVVAAVDRTFGTTLRDLRTDVDELKRAAG